MVDPKTKGQESTQNKGRVRWRKDTVRETERPHT